MVKETEIGFIQGIMPKSRYEWYTARALWLHKWAFEYQVPIMGGRTLKGGQIVDFMVKTLPVYTPIYVEGEYYHSKQRERDKYLKALLFSALGDQYKKPITLTGDDVGTEQQAYQTIKNLFGRFS